MAGRISVTAEVVGVGSDGTEPSLVFAVHRHGVYSADQTLLKRYLFNCGEGTQRLCGENGIKLNSLDAIFLTRLDVCSASGIPGLVFALGGLGAAHLRIHGPTGTRDRLGAMASFVRRKYPKIECVEVGHAGGKSADEDDRSEIARHHWEAGEPQEDAYVRVIAVPLSSEARAVPPCWICANCTPLKEKPAATPVKQPPTGDETTESHDPDRRWLRRFYESKGLRDKIPHMDVILRRYQGRMDDLKAQLVNKYGDGESDSESSSSDSDDGKDEGNNTTESAFDATAPLDREWLEAFYQRYEPVKVGRVDQILRQFAGREDQLKGMLLSKYSETQEQNDSPPVKKQKINDSRVEIPRDQDGVSSIPIPEAFVDGDAPTHDELTAIPMQPTAPPLCYILQFRAPPFPVVWIVDCQTTQQIDLLSTRLASGDGCGHLPVLVVHLSPSDLVHHPKYQSWIGGLQRSSGSNAIEHLVFDGHALRKMVGGVFSFAFVASAHNYLKNQAARTHSLPEDSRWQTLQDLLAPGDLPPSSLQLRIRKRCDEATVVTSVAQAKLKYTLEDSAVEDYSLTGWKYIVEKKANEQEEDAESQSTPPLPSQRQIGGRSLSILGTGSAAPSKLRASTSMYLSLSPEPENGALPGMLIDCGEGTFGQLQRQFDTDAALTARLVGLKCIWISHHHADHQCGLLRVLDEYVRVTRASSDEIGPLFLIAPQSVLDYARAWLPSLPSRIHLMTCAEMNDNPRDLQQHLSEYVSDMRSVRVWHCHDAYGLIMRLRDGAKLVYSGDTKPCDQLVRAGMDASLLIHEATFDDSMEDDADKKKHSTVGQAIGVARRMRAKRLVLTHFSQRYPSLPPPMSSDAAGSTYPLEIFSAFDGFTVDV